MVPDPYNSGKNGLADGFKQQRTISKSGQGWQLVEPVWHSVTFQLSANILNLVVCAAR